MGLNGLIYSMSNTFFYIVKPTNALIGFRENRVCFVGSSIEIFKTLMLGLKAVQNARKMAAVLCRLRITLTT